MAETKGTRRSRKKGKGKSRVPLILLGLLCAGLLVFAGYQIFTLLSEYRQGRSTYEELSQYMNLPTAQPGNDLPASTDPQSSSLPTLPSGDMSGLTDWDAMDQNKDALDLPVVNFEALRAINEDVVGWIYYPTMDINYPVVQGESNDSYLYRMFDGRRNGAGSIFMDYRNMPDMSDPHTVLYGHHMNDGSMFAKITQYKKDGFYEEHPFFYYITPDAYFRVDVISSYTCGSGDEAWKLDFESEEAVEEWAQKLHRRARFDAPYEYSVGDRFMTLSTCSYEFDDARYVVTGVLRQIG